MEEGAKDMDWAGRPDGADESGNWVSGRHYPTHREVQEVIAKILATIEASPDWHLGSGARSIPGDSPPMEGKLTSGGTGPDETWKGWGRR